MNDAPITHGIPIYPGNCQFVLSLLIVPCVGNFPSVPTCTLVRMLVQNYGYLHACNVQMCIARDFFPVRKQETFERLQTLQLTYFIDI